MQLRLLQLMAQVIHIILTQQAVRVGVSSLHIFVQPRRVSQWIAELLQLSHQLTCKSGIAALSIEILPKESR